ncbi:MULTISPECIES: Trm112 family protein [Rufibacter]|uniref:Uncharacterized protein YbaR (Trm112 family) n=1 Tax=Rufibacter quisquiliarum TaxID=1549639 RepID=A0A839GTC1_9BACT|nr:MULTISPECIES: Trm112 family protein [Rufibacter]MBA9077658.1 uncharacterized protein YbaR (Trm112 family) [Rufibacter quisquiliarum]
MRLETIKKLCCPFDKADIELTTITQDPSGNILEGFFTCSECSRLYPIVKGIPIMSPDEYREINLEKPLLAKWQQHLQGKTFENFRLVPQKGEKDKFIG